MHQIIFYEDANGKSETFDYFQRLSHSRQKQDVAIFKKLTHQMNLLGMLGKTLHEPQAKFIKGLVFPLWELRPMPERVFYGCWHGDTFIILNHYTKKQNKTDPRELKKAIAMLQDWYERKGM